jgi:hypothetical protein
VSTLYEAADRYRAAAIAARDAAARSRLTRRDPDATPREIAKANQASLDARRALEHARDQLVAAALAHECAP